MLRKTIFNFSILVGCQIMILIIDTIQLRGDFSSDYDNFYKCKSNLYTCPKEYWGSPGHGSACFNEMVD